MEVGGIEIELNLNENSGALCFRLKNPRFSVVTNYKPSAITMIYTHVADASIRKTKIHLIMGNIYLYCL